MSHTGGSNYRANHIDVEAFYQQGESLANLGHYPEALTAFDQAIAAHTPTHSTSQLASTWVFRAVVLLHLQSYDEALTSCDRALELEPKHVEAWVFRGVALNYLEQYPESYSSYAKAMTLAQPQTTSHWRSFPQALFAREDRLGARADHRLRSYQLLFSSSDWPNRIRSTLQRWWQKLKHLRFHH